MHAAVRYIHDNAHLLMEEGPKSDAQRRLSEKSVRVMKDSKGTRLLQATDLGGFQSHPLDFLEWVMAVAQYDPSAGWIAGVVGVHPWEISLMDPRVQQEIYGVDPDVWTASPYAPLGRATRVDGGYLFSGRWSYSTGTDYCDWVVLGGMVTDDDGNLGTPPQMRHFVLPRGDYEIVEDSWHIMGLSGTGSKDVRMTNAFVPDYRTIDATVMMMGAAKPFAEALRPGVPLYRMGMALLFSGAIGAATLGIATGAIRVYREYLEQRVSVAGKVGKTDPFQLAALARAESDLDASITHLRTKISAFYDQVCAGEEITITQRQDWRRDQVRATDRMVSVIDELYRLSGANGVWKDKPLERFWRDLHTGAMHACNLREDVYVGWGAAQFGQDPPRPFAF